MNQALEVLASRIGSIQQLPELHVLIHDTVNATLRGIKGVVEAQVNRQLETDKLGIVEDMVSRLLTEEVMKVTNQSAQALTRREVEHISSNQTNLHDSVSMAERAWKQRFDDAEKSRSALESRLRELTSGYEKSSARIEEVESSVTRLRGSLPSADEVKEHVSQLSAKIDKAAIREDDRVRELTELEGRCQGLYSTKAEVSDMAQRIDSLARQQHDHGDAWLSNRLEAYVLDEVMGQRLVKVEQELHDAVHRLQESCTRDLDEVRLSTFSTTRDLGATKANKREVQELGEETASARAKMETELRTEITALRTAVYGHIDEAVEAQHNERQKLSDTFHEAQSEVQAESVELHSLIGVAREQIQRNSDKFENLVTDVRKLGSDITSLSEQHAKIREGFTDEKMRCEAIFNQQQHNRSELNFMIQRTNDIETLRTGIKSCQDGVEEHAERIAVLGQEVSQWEHAIAAQQGLRRETAELRDGVENNRQAMEQITQQQLVGISNLRSLHDHWLQGEAA